MPFIMEKTFLLSIVSNIVFFYTQITMKGFSPFYVIALLLVSLLAILRSYSEVVYAQDAPIPTSTYDPLVEPPLPENPSDYELGRNWYWHHCMPCHGDVGQGLTDEFRAIWPDDHQNCWGRGCHTGHIEDLGFPIPTVVPALVSNAKLAQFSSQQALFDYLKATHPPQHPGYLTDEQYRAITLYVFSLNDRLDLTPTDAALPAFTSTPGVVADRELPLKANTFIYIGLGTIFAVVVIWSVKRRLEK